MVKQSQTGFLRIAPDVSQLVSASAAANGRTFPAEVNFVLRNWYASLPAPKGKSK